GSYRRPSPNTARKASSKRSRSRCWEHSTARRASRASSREPASMTDRALWAASSSPTPTREPCQRMTAARSLSGPVTGSDAIQDSTLTHAQQVLVHLERGAERLVKLRVIPDGEQRLGPDDRLPHAGQLVQIPLLAQAADGVHDPRGHALGNPGQTRVHNVPLASRAGVVDPVVEAAAFE